MDFYTAFKKARRRIYCTVILSILSCVYLLNAILYVRQGGIILFLPALCLGAADFLLIKKYRARAISSSIRPNPEDVQAAFDKYARRTVNWLLIVFLRVFAMALTFITLSVNSKADELLEFFLGNLFTLEFVIFFFAKNLLIVAWLNKNYASKNHSKFTKSLRRVFIISLIYWILASLLYYLFEKIFVLNISFFVIGLFLLAVIVYNFTKINAFTYSKKGTIELSSRQFC